MPVCIPITSLHPRPLLTEMAVTTRQQDDHSRAVAPTPPPHDHHARHHTHSSQASRTTKHVLASSSRNTSSTDLPHKRPHMETHRTVKAARPRGVSQSQTLHTVLILFALLTAIPPPATIVVGNESSDTDSEESISLLEDHRRKTERCEPPKPHRELRPRSSSSSSGSQSDEGLSGDDAESDSDSANADQTSRARLANKLAAEVSHSISMSQSCHVYLRDWRRK